MAYFPVKFILNKSLNNTAIVIDEVQRKWSIYILDKTDLSEGVSGNPSWLENDTLAMPISIDEIDINSSGFYSLDSYKAYLDFCTQRKTEERAGLKQSMIIKIVSVNWQKNLVNWLNLSHKLQCNSGKLMKRLR